MQILLAGRIPLNIYFKLALERPLQKKKIIKDVSVGICLDYSPVNWVTALQFQQEKLPKEIAGSTLPSAVLLLNKNDVIWTSRSIEERRYRPAGKQERARCGCGDVTPDSPSDTRNSHPLHSNPLKSSHKYEAPGKTFHSFQYLPGR